MVISMSRSGLPTAAIDGKFIHSNHEPVREAERLAASEISEKYSACIVEGFGLGYYVEAILRLRPEIPVVIVEPSAERFLKSLESRNLSDIFTSPSVSLLVANESDSIRLLLPGLPKVISWYFSMTTRALIRIFSSGWIIISGILKLQVLADRIWL